MKTVQKKQLFETWFKNFPFVGLAVTVNKAVNINRRLNLLGESSKINYSLCLAEPLQTQVHSVEIRTESSFQRDKPRCPGGMSYTLLWRRGKSWLNTLAFKPNTTQLHLTCLPCSRGIQIPAMLLFCLFCSIYMSVLWRHAFVWRAGPRLSFQQVHKTPNPNRGCAS